MIVTATVNVVVLVQPCSGKAMNCKFMGLASKYGECQRGGRGAGSDGFLHTSVEPYYALWQKQSNPSLCSNALQHRFYDGVLAWQAVYLIIFFNEISIEAHRYVSMHHRPERDGARLKA